MENKPIKNELMKRFELHNEGHLAVLDYEEQGEGVLVFIRTLVPPALRGRKVAAILTKFALDDARHHGKRVMPQCNYTAVYLERNAKYSDLRADV